MESDTGTDNRRQLDGEWLALTSTREVLNLAKGSASYKEALAVGAKLMPSVLGDDSLLRKNQVSPEARYFIQKATAQRQSGQTVTANDLIQQTIAEHEELIKHLARSDTDSLRKKLRDLKAVLDELAVERHEEGSLIVRDAYNVARKIPNMPDDVLGKGYKDVYLSEKEILRIRVFHPEKAEAITGADIVFEKHHPTEERATIAAVQYKLWDDRRLLLDERTMGQIGRMESFFCKQNTCSGRDDANNYRFPYCAAFFRPTDKLQSPAQELRTTGEHIPICRVPQLVTTGPRHGKYIEYDCIRHVSLNHDVFEDLFTNDKVGSRSLSYAELENLYSKISAHIGDQIVILAQRFDT